MISKMSCKGATTVEWIVVVGIIAAIAAILVPAIK